jgi:glycosyltransferase involved in cell wall biosynthesis
VYQRDSTVIYPPINVERFFPNKRRQKYFITVSRLVSHKRIDLLIGAFNQLKLPLVIVGEGPERDKLEQMAGPSIQFLGYLPDKELASLLANAQAFVCAGEEDFGIAAVEAQAAGCPVIAYGKGGVRETLTPGETGILFNEPTIESLAEAIRWFTINASSFDAHHISTCVQRFNKKRFQQEYSEFVTGQTL